TAPNTAIQSPAFAVAANTLIVAFISTDGPTTAGFSVNTVNNNNSTPNTPITFTRAQRANTQLGTSEIWWAFAPAQYPSMRVTATLPGSGVVAQLTVVGFTGAQNTLVGAATAIANKATGVAGNPTLTITTTKANSWVFGVGNDWDNRKTLTAGAGATIIAQSPARNTDTFWAVRSTTPVAGGGTPTLIAATPTATAR